MEFLDYIKSVQFFIFDFKLRFEREASWLLKFVIPMYLQYSNPQGEIVRLATCFHLTQEKFHSTRSTERQKVLFNVVTVAKWARSVKTVSQLAKSLPHWQVCLQQQWKPFTYSQTFPSIFLRLRYFYSLDHNG